MRSDAPFYILALLFGAAAGFLQIRIGDLLVTALFVMICTMLLGALRPRRPWRWTILVAVCVPIAQLAAYLSLHEMVFRAQIWESGAGFLTGIAGAYCGAFARKAVQELFRPNPIPPNHRP